MGKTVVYLLQLAFLILAFVGGWLGFSYINQVSTQADWGFWWIVAVIFVTVAAIVVGLFLNIVLHEGGHLIGGLLTGYRFVSFGVFSLTIIKENGKIVIKQYRAPGTGGGCMLSPPDMKDGKYPSKLFISGGFSVNFIVGAVCFILVYCLADTAGLWARAFLVIGIIGVFLGLVNFIPHKVVAPNDGYMLFNLGKKKNSEMRRGCWSGFRIQALNVEGYRPRDIPSELFDWADTSNISDIFVFDTVYKRYEYLLDKQELTEARSLMQTLCEKSSNVPDMQKYPCYCELLFHELIGECRQEEIERLYTKELKDYIKAAPSELNMRRFLYAYAMLALKDETKAKEYLDLFNKACAESIWSGTVRGEQALIMLIDTIACKRGK